jgi:hypothetical protein
MKGCSPGLTTTINVGAVQRATAAIQVLGTAVELANFKEFSDVIVSKIAEANGIPVEMLVLDDVSDFNISQLKAYALEPLKPQPFWTQQGRHKKGGRGKY